MIYKSKLLTQSQVRFVKLFALMLFSTYKFWNEDEFYKIDRNISFYREIFELLKTNQLEDILPANNFQVLIPLRPIKHKFENIGIKLYKVGSSSNATIDIIDREEKKAYNVKVSPGDTFGHDRKNVVVRGDFSIIYHESKKNFFIIAKLSQY